MNPVVENYGWTDVVPTCSAEYLIEPVVAALNRAGAKRIIDLGCGNGAMSHLLQSRGFQVLGCDPDARGIELASRTPSGAKFVRAGFYDSPEVIGERDFDAAVSTEVIEHLFEPKTLPHFASQILKPRGLLIVSTPYHGWLKNVLISLTGHWDIHHGPLQDGGHIKFFSTATLSKLLSEQGFTVEQFFGAGRLPLLWKSMILTARKKKPWGGNFSGWMECWRVRVYPERGQWSDHFPDRLKVAVARLERGFWRFAGSALAD